MITSRYRPATAAWVLSLSLALLVAACGDAPAPGDGDPGAPGQGSGAPETTGPGGTADPAASPPAATPDSALHGDFRRAGVAIPPDVAREGEQLCRTKPVPPYAEEVGTRKMVVSDLRGLGVLLFVFADGQGATGCRVEVDQAGGMQATHFAVTRESDGELERGAITLGALEYAEAGTSQRTIAVGRVGEGAVKVRAGFDDDTYVTSTMTNGWYAMWWPGAVKAIVIVAADNKNVAMGKLTPP